MVYNYEVQYPVLVKWISNNRERWNEIAKINMRLHYERHGEFKKRREREMYHRRTEFKKMCMIDIH
jgi:hypothetical protein